MLNLNAMLQMCGFENVTPYGDSPFADCEVWAGGQPYWQAIGVADDWSGWDHGGVSQTFWRTYGEESNREHDEVVVYCDRIVIIDRTHRRLAVTCRCEPDGCALAAELVQTWFATGQ